MKTTNIKRNWLASLRKVVSIVLILCMAFSLAACNGGGDDNRESKPSVPSTEKPIETKPEEPNQHIDPGANLPTAAPTIEHTSEAPTVEPTTEPTVEPTAEPTVEPGNGEYTYTIYGKYEVTMDINVNDYIFVSEYTGKTCFRFYQLAFDLGWQTFLGYTEKDNNNPISYRETIYFRFDGDLSSRFELSDWAHSDTKALAGMSLSYWHKGTAEPYFDGNRRYENSDSFVEKTINSTNEYVISGPEYSASYDDIVLMSYMIWKATEEPGVNPIFPIFGQENSTSFYKDQTSYLFTT